MRVIIMAAVLIAALVGGFLVYRGNGSEHLGPAAPAVAPLHTECTVADAVYQYNEDQRLQLRFRRVPRAADAGPDFANGAGGHQIGNMMFVVTVTSFATESSRGMSGIICISELNNCTGICAPPPVCGRT